MVILCSKIGWFYPLSHHLKPVIPTDVVTNQLLLLRQCADSIPEADHFDPVVYPKQATGYRFHLKQVIHFLKKT